ncbi:MAG: LamG-like jellyroll fold domain-containing protein, partial [Bacteroidales bacterium]
MKHKLFFITLLVLSNLLYSQIPVASYPFNGNANDVSGNANNGILGGEVANPTLTSDRFGNANSAYLFGGYFNKNWIQIPNSSTLAFNNQLSISLWFKQCSFAGMDGWGSYNAHGYHILISKAGDGIAANPGIYSGIYTDLNNFLYVNFSNTNGYYQTHNFDISSNVNCFDTCEWIHYVIVINDTNSKVYYNGQLAMQQTINPADFTNANTQDFFIGRMNGGGTIWYPLNGIIDDVNIYNVAINQSKVTALYGNYINPLAVNNIISLDSLKILNPSCGNTNSGSISIYPNSNNAPYQFSINGGLNYFSSNIFSNLTSGTYNIKIKTYCNEKDTIITLTSSVANIITNNVSICQGNSYILPNGSIAFVSGSYIDTLKTTLGCDSLIITTNLVINLKPIINLGNDTTLNQGSTLNLNAGNTGSTYLWSTGSNTQTINVNTSGTYWVKVSNSGGCFSSDTINISFTTTTNPMNDTTICKGEAVTLTASASLSGGSWQYFQDFENSIGSEWSDTNRFTFNGSKNLGPFIDSAIILNLNSLPAHDSVEVSFDLYIHDSWDGNIANNGSDIGPDIFMFKINNDSLLYASFTNISGFPQSYPSNYSTPIVNNPRFTGCYLSNLPGLAPGNITSLYKLSYLISNNSNNLNLQFIDKTINIASNHLLDESWSIDSVKVKLLNVNNTPQYLWSTGATTASITVSPNQSTNYSVTVTNGSTIFADSATVNVLNPQINNGADTTICKGESVVLSTQTSSQNTCNKSQLPANLQQGLVAFYPFCGNANDESGNGNNGTVNGATLTTDRFGNANRAYSFDGINNNIIVPNNPSINLSGNEITISYWMKWFNNNNDPNYKGVSKGGVDLLSGYELMIRGSYNGDNGWAHFPIPFNAGYVGANCSNTNQYWGQWINLVGVFKNGIGKIYINGTITVIDSLIGATSILPNNHNLYIGTRDPVNAWVGHLNGSLDDIFIYNRALSSSEVNQLYNLGSSNTTASTYHWSTNNTTQSITVTPTQTTTYTLTVTNGNISCMDTITVNVFNPHTKPLTRYINMLYICNMK